MFICLPHNNNNYVNLRDNKRQKGGQVKMVGPAERERNVNKAVHTVISVACGWAGAVMSLRKT